MLKHLKLGTKPMALCLSLLAMLVAGSTLYAQGGLLNKQELKTLIANSHTPADHERLAKHFTAKAAQLEADAKDHEELAVVYAKSARKEAPIQTADHCKNLADAARKAAQASQELAKLHEEMAKSGK